MSIAYIAITFHASHACEWQKPLEVLASGQYGEVLNLKRIKADVYQLVLKLDEDTPEEVLQVLRENGVFVLRMFVYADATEDEEGYEAYKHNRFAEFVKTPKKKKKTK